MVYLTALNGLPVRDSHST